MLLRTLRTIQNKIALLNKKILLKKSDGSIVGFDDLQAAMAAASSGDLIKINAPGIYNLGANPLTLKNVNIFCVPDVTISGSGSSVLTDNNQIIDVTISGNPKIVNSSTGKNFNIQNALSKLVCGDYYFGYDIYKANRKAVTVNIPVITAGERYVKQVDLGEIGNPSAILLGAFASGYDSTQLEKFVQNANLNNDGWSMACTWPFLHFSFKGVRIHNDSGDITAGALTVFNTIYITEDYKNALRLTRASGAEKYGAGAGTSVPQNNGYTYRDINVGVLFGWYSLSNKGPFFMDKKIEVESAWISNNNGSTILNMAFFNRDVADNTAKDIKILVLY